MPFFSTIRGPHFPTDLKSDVKIEVKNSSAHCVSSCGCLHHAASSRARLLCRHACKHPALAMFSFRKRGDGVLVMIVTSWRSILFPSAVRLMISGLLSRSCIWVFAPAHRELIPTRCGHSANTHHGKTQFSAYFEQKQIHRGL